MNYSHTDPIAARMDDDPYRGVDYDGKPSRSAGVRIAATPFVWREPADIPPRRWLFGGHYIRGYVTGTVAPGGMGKTSVVQTEALSMVTGRDLLGIKPDLASLKAWIWNLEDPTEEVERRFAASVVHHGINPHDLAGRMFVNSGRDTPLVIARKVKDAITVAEPVIDALVAEIDANGIDVLIIDPFVSSHGLPENDNAAIDAAVKAWGRVAGRGNCSVELVHHSRKLNGDAISADSARGGSAFVDGCRAVRVINRMSEEEATRLGVDEARRFFFMLADKQNMAPPADKRDWYQLVSVPLANGDNVAAVDKWTPPNPFDDVTLDHLRRVQALFASSDYRESEQSPEWGGNAVATVLDLDVGAGRKASERTGQQKAARAKIKGILRTWQDSGAIILETRADAKRMSKLFYACGEPA